MPAKRSFSKSFMGRILKVLKDGGAPRARRRRRGRLAEGSGVGLAEFKRVVRVAVNFLLQDGSG